MSDFPHLSLLVLLLLASSVSAQTRLQLTFRGTSYQTNVSGNIIGVPLTGQTLLQQAALAGGVTDLSSLALVYHVNGSIFGDTIDVVNSASGATSTLFGFYFGEATSMTPDRTAITNATRTEVRRIDYIYTPQNTHSMGSGFLTKRFLADRNGNVRAIIDAQMQWIILPQGTNGAAMCKATFTTTRPFP